MIRHCRAYDLTTLRQSSDFAAAVPTDQAGSVAYVWDDHSVTLNPFADEESLIARDSGTWHRFCDDVLGHTTRPS